MELIEFSAALTVGGKAKIVKVVYKDGVPELRISPMPATEAFHLLGIEGVEAVSGVAAPAKPEATMTTFTEVLKAPEVKAVVEENAVREMASVATAAAPALALAPAPKPTVEATIPPAKRGRSTKKGTLELPLAQPSADIPHPEVAIAAALCPGCRAPKDKCTSTTEKCVKPPAPKESCAMVGEDGVCGVHDHKPEVAAPVEVKPDILPAQVVGAEKMRDLLEYLHANGFKTVASIVEECKRIKDKVPLLQRVANLDDRVVRACAVLGLGGATPAA